MPGAAPRVALVADSNQPGKPVPRSAVLEPRGFDHRRQRGLGPARAAARRSLVLSCGGVCAARPVAGSAWRTDRRGARRQEDQRRARARPPARPDAARCVFRHRPLSLLCRRRPGRREDAALAPAAARRRSRPGTARDAAGARPGRAPRRAKPISSSISSICGTNSKTADAIALLERLDARYPHNPLFRQRIAEIRDGYLHDHAASAAAWQMLLERALAGTVYSPRTTEVRARLGLASVLSAMNRTAEAIDRAAARRRHASERTDRRARARGTRTARRARAKRATMIADRYDPDRTFFDFFCTLCLTLVVSRP